jgi:hypothetical protein
VSFFQANITEGSIMGVFVTTLSLSVMLGTSKPNITDARSTWLVSGMALNTNIQSKRIVLDAGMMLKVTTKPDSGAQINRGDCWFLHSARVGQVHDCWFRRSVLVGQVLGITVSQLHSGITVLRVIVVVRVAATDK